MMRLTDQHTETRHLHTVAEDELQNVPAASTECDADADFLCALPDEIGNHAIDADTRKNQCQCGKQAEQD